MLHKNELGHLSVYVPKKDLEEEVVEQTTTPEGKVLTLANGWQLSFKDITDDMKLPQTLNAKRL
ncbi:MAG: putative nitrogen fixation protein NifT [Xenococcaceae cyanobacterium MO_207.B15]|nr:putative nitrogen fixation protein NifT [Xenococcaceae cyanobacterium MO_207.B15]MDJ0741742.1 putative nitrogen fixation protein NifT [Xenococcaceae cyanobacterium MO_167.B27]